MSDDVLPRDLAKVALAYAAHQAARCATPGGRHGECSCDVEEFRRQEHLARGHALCPTCQGAREVPAGDPVPGATTWKECPTCDGLGNVDLTAAEPEDADGAADAEAPAPAPDAAAVDARPPTRGRPPALANGPVTV